MSVGMMGSGRPTMISAKYRLKEERRRLLKMSISKLRRIEDPESALRRSVLINNTVRRLQREQREQREARQATALLFVDSPLSLREDDAPAAPAAAAPATAPFTAESPSVTAAAVEPAGLVLEELEDVLSQFYMPPTPRMITSIDEDEAMEAASGGKRPAAPSRQQQQAKRPRLERSDDDEGRALADPTNTLEDFKDEVYLRSKPRVPLASAANAPTCDEVLRAELCGRPAAGAPRFTGHDRENIAPLDSMAAMGSSSDTQNSLQHSLTHSLQHSLQQSLSLQHSLQHSLGLQHSLQPYSCSQAHGQAQANLQSGLVFHGLMATMES